MGDAEAVLAGGRLLGDVDLVDVGARRAHLAPGDHLGHRARLTLEDGFDVALLGVADPPVDTEIAGVAAAGVAEPHPLHVTVHEHPTANHGSSMPHRTGCRVAATVAGVASRIDPPLSADERTMLAAFLDYHRATLLLKVSGVSEAEARQPLLPGGLTLLGLVRHLAEVERSWFRKGFAGEDIPYRWCDEEDPDRDFHPADDDTLADALAAYEEECEVARRIVAAAGSLDELEAKPGRHGPVSLRWILLHMIEETARHNGHADLLREAVDGTVGE